MNCEATKRKIAKLLRLLKSIALQLSDKQQQSGSLEVVARMSARLVLRLSPILCSIHRRQLRLRNLTWKKQANVFLRKATDVINCKVSLQASVRVAIECLGWKRKEAKSLQMILLCT